MTTGVAGWRRVAVKSQGMCHPPLSGCKTHWEGSADQLNLPSRRTPPEGGYRICRSGQIVRFQGLSDFPTFSAYSKPSEDLQESAKAMQLICLFVPRLGLNDATMPQDIYKLVLTGKFAQQRQREAGR